MPRSRLVDFTHALCHLSYPSKRVESNPDPWNAHFEWVSRCALLSADGADRQARTGSLRFTRAAHLLRCFVGVVQ